MKSQALPIRAIVFIVLMVIVVAALIVFVILYGHNIWGTTQVHLNIAENATQEAGGMV